MSELGELIGTETCGCCGKLTECISLPDDGDDVPNAACEECISKAFKEHWADVDERATERVR